MNFVIRDLIWLGMLKKDLDYHLLRAVMVINDEPWKRAGVIFKGSANTQFVPDAT